MLNTSSNRGTPVSGENITKIIRQHYKPRSPKPYKHETVQSRTETTCKKEKPEDYWVTNYHRRQQNFDKGFYSISTEPYRPIGGDLYLDPYELVVSALPGNMDKKFQPRMTRRGTVYESGTPTLFDEKEDMSDGSSSHVSQDQVDMCPSAGFDDIKKLMRESRDRIISVRAGRGYEDHVRAMEEQCKAAKEASRPVETGMVLQSLSSIGLPLQSQDKGSRSHNTSPTLKSGLTTPTALAYKAHSDREKRKYSVANAIKKGVVPPKLRTRSPSTFIKLTLFNKKPKPVEEEESNKLSLMQCSSGITTVLLRKERQFKDHYLFLKWIFNVLTALHNLKVRDIRSKTPLSKDLVERLQKEGPFISKEDERGSRGTYGNCAYTKKGGTQLLTPEEQFSFTQADREPAQEVTAKKLWTSILEGSLKKAAVRKRPTKIHNPHWFTALKSAQKKTAVLSRWGKSTRMSTMDMDNEDTQSLSGGRMSVFGMVKRMNAVDTIGKSFFGRRRSKNAAGLQGGDRPALETWEDLLNVQPQEYKEENCSLGFQVGIVSKFIKWYRRTSMMPHQGGALVGPDQLSHLQEIHDKGQENKGAEKEPVQPHPTVGSAAEKNTDKQKKLPIWQQVAQEKSTVFHNKKNKAPNPDTTILRFRRDLNKLKQSIQKENTAELEKLVRERVASFRLKYSTLNIGECSPLFEDQVTRIEHAKGSVNRTHLENFDVQPSKWYDELREKTNTLVSTFDQPHILEMMAKLQTFAHMDNKTVPYCKAKLCLLMMSLPAYDICQIYVQRALKFIFDNILLGQEAQFNEWLNHRKIPYVVLSDPRPKSGASVMS